MSDSILSLPRNLRSANNRHDFRPYVSFMGFAFYISVHCGFDKHIYLTNCLNAHVYVFPKQVVLREKIALFITTEDRPTQVLAGDAMATTID